jgi:hypothetical protein
MIWVGSMFYPGTGNDWNLPREIQNPPAYAMQNDKAQFILESTGLEGYRGYGAAPRMAMRRTSASAWRGRGMPAPVTSEVNQGAFGGYGRQSMPQGNMAAFGGSARLTGLRGNIPFKGYRGNIPLRGYGAVDIQSAMGMPARLQCSRTPSGMINCKPRYSFSWDEYANRIQL